MKLRYPIIVFLLPDTPLSYPMTLLLCPSNTFLSLPSPSFDSYLLPILEYWLRREPISPEKCPDVVPEEGLWLFWEWCIVLPDEECGRG